jgi:hypothetical protein
MYKQMKRTDKLRRKAIAMALACACIAKEFNNPSEIADGIMDFDPDHDLRAVYAELGSILDKMQKEMFKATDSYLKNKVKP